MTDYVNLADALLKASGTPVSRTLGDHLGDVINVKSFSSVKTAIEAAYGTVASPHGLDLATTNRKVFIPAGSYNISTPIDLPYLCGAHIVGAGCLSTILNYTGSVPGGATVTPIFRVNGMANCTFENFSCNISGDNTCSVDSDWDGTSGGDGLHHNTFLNMGFGGESGFLLARSDNGGNNHLFLNCVFNTSYSEGAGLDVIGSAAYGTHVIGGGGQGYNVFKISAGQLEVDGASVEGMNVGFNISGTARVKVSGVRTEHANFFSISGGNVTIRCCDHTVSGVYADITGGKVIIDSGYFNANNSPIACYITGDGGELYLRANSHDTDWLDYYTGTIIQELPTP